MASIREILKALTENRGAPETGAGSGRSSYLEAGPKKPIKGLKTALAGPAAQRDYGPQVSGNVNAPPIPPLAAATATPPPQQMAAAPPQMAAALRQFNPDSLGAPSPLPAAGPPGQPPAPAGPQPGAPPPSPAPAANRMGVQIGNPSASFGDAPPEEIVDPQGPGGFSDMPIPQTGEDPGIPDIAQGPPDEAAMAADARNRQQQYIMQLLQLINSQQGGSAGGPGGY